MSTKAGILSHITSIGFASVGGYINVICSYGLCSGNFIVGKH